MDFSLRNLFLLFLANFFISVLSAQNPCFNGDCIPIQRCPPLLNILKSNNLRPEQIKFLQDSQCGFVGRNPNVCCPKNSGPENTPRPPINQGENPDPSPNLNVRNHPLLPSDCGQDVDERIVGGERTDIDEFPWMVLLEYQKPNGITTACGGVLISKRYVLTAAHCLKGKDLPKSWKLSRVRLGEYDTAQEIDCINESGSRVCADPTVTVPIEEQIAHEDYIPTAKEQRNDIALLRLARDVTFSHYVKPICLPEDPSLGRLLDVAGWGKTEIRSESNFKLKVRLPLVQNDECRRTYQNAGVELGDGQICAGGQVGKDSCRGDSGGPLMSRVRAPNDDKPKWVSVGVVSFGPSPCGMPGWPGVYSKVHDFVPWILQNIKE
ncbi:CLIP domain-containing serine protease 2-like [Belonocnema kinseyi]|uniref:CLIP domain-containing serine protease 2-like n=1 Tax=Belonocnema kinseyi TaxID=2817044 RepID=UPI00143D3DFE|nr:CLIP domain-containing serine protease 2-like [Belonocnema kinseyi]